MGQNCAGPERFFVYEKVYEEFCDKVAALVKQMRCGPSLGDPFVDCGAICMGARQMQAYQKLIDDAVSKGARVLAGGYIPKGSDPLAKGSFYPPTVLADVPENAKIAQEEIFGPIMCIFKVQTACHSDRLLAQIVEYNPTNFHNTMPCYALPCYALPCCRFLEIATPRRCAWRITASLR
jgi:acyl-CoA reductase-like NAD-dependent aldehyde dehydrogenase